jgi:hypothetical protein
MSTGDRLSLNRYTNSYGLHYDGLIKHVSIPCSININNDNLKDNYGP